MWSWLQGSWGRILWGCKFECSLYNNRLRCWFSKTTKGGCKHWQGRSAGIIYWDHFQTCTHDHICLWTYSLLIWPHWCFIRGLTITLFLGCRDEMGYSGIQSIAPKVMQMDLFRGFTGSEMGVSIVAFCALERLRMQSCSVQEGSRMQPQRPRSSLESPWCKSVLLSWTGQSQMSTGHSRKSHTRTNKMKFFHQANLLLPFDSIHAASLLVGDTHTQDGIPPLSLLAYLPITFGNTSKHTQTCVH